MYIGFFSVLSYIIPSFSCFFKKHGTILRLKRIFFFQIPNLVRKPYSLYIVIQHHLRAIFLQRIGSTGERLWNFLAHKIPNTFSLSFQGKNTPVEMFLYSFIKEASDKYYFFLSTKGDNLYALTYWLTLLKLLTYTVLMF